MNTAPTIDASHVRRTYTAVLGEPRLGLPPLGSEEQRAHVAGLLRGQLRILVWYVIDRTPELRGANLQAAEHVSGRALEALEVGVAEARAPEHMYDLALLTRALLALHEMAAPQPLTSSARS